MEKESITKIIIIVFCLAAASGITLFLRSGSGRQGLEDVQGQMLQVKCAACGAEYKMEITEYYEFRREHADPVTQMVLQPPCMECGKNSIYEKEVLNVQDY
jgi:endogenous inhibitor of DNA gyrase (YacG/DUF329 family)